MAALGLLLLAVAAVVAIAGVAANTGGGHLLGRSVDVLGYHLSGSTGQLLLVGIVIGAVGMLGLNMLLAGLGRGLKKSVSSRRQLKSTRKQGQAAAQERDQLAAELAQEQAARTEEGRAAAPTSRRPTVASAPDGPAGASRQTDRRP